MPTWEQIHRAIDKTIKENQDIMESCMGNPERAVEFARAFNENVGIYAVLNTLIRLTREDDEKDPIDTTKAYDISDVN